MAEDLEQRLRDGLEGVQGGPWHLDKHAVYIFAPAEKGGAFPLGDEVCGGRVMRLRGWGYYTGRGHGALALPEDEAAKRQRLTGEHIARCSPENIAALLDALATSRARSEALEKQIAAASTWFWPEDDTSSEACRDSPGEVFEDMPDGDIAAYSCGGIVYTRWYGRLPAADDADSDDYFEVDEPTEAEAQAKMNAEIERRAALSLKQEGKGNG